MRRTNQILFDLQREHPYIHYLVRQEIEGYCGHFQNLTAHPLNAEYQTIPEFIRLSFDWSMSVHGMEFWKAVHTSLSIMEQVKTHYIKADEQEFHSPPANLIASQLLAKYREVNYDEMVEMIKAHTAELKEKGINSVFWTRQQMPVHCLSHWLLNAFDWSESEKGSAYFQELYMKILKWELPV